MIDPEHGPTRSQMSATDSASADLQQTIADLQRQLAERTAERDEAQAREAATADVLRVINSSPGNLMPVFDAILEKATRLCKASFGISWRYDRDATNRNPWGSGGICRFSAYALQADTSHRPACAGRCPVHPRPG